MGLDMYLTRKKFIGAQYEHRKVKGNIDISILDKKIPINLDKVSYIEESVAYWRKANQIHKWFVDNIQNGEDDCREYYVEVSQLKELLDICKQVKEKAILKTGTITNGYKYEDGKQVPILEEGQYIENWEEIEALLPTSDGFFFGSTQYDEWYIRDIDYTIETLEEVLKEESELNKQDFYSEYCYRASW